MERRVVITGAAAITPIGSTRSEIIKHLTEGLSGVRPMRDDELLVEHIHCKVFGTVADPPAFEFARRDRKTMGPVSYYACQVATDALAASGLSDEFIRSGRLGVAFGSTHGSPTTFSPSQVKGTTSQP